jgi:N-acetylglucosaminyldiphosphoundecaprenol N-acetyl-beta-D-mannosaminyltransferase
VTIATPDLAPTGEIARTRPEGGPVNILGVGVTPTDLDGALEQIDRWIHRRERQYVCVTGVHGVMESQRDEALRHIHNRAGMVTTDGMPLVWISRLKGHKRVRRVYGPDLMLACCERSVAPGHRHFLYGGAPGVAELLAERLVSRLPGLIIAGTWTPPFRPLSDSERIEITSRINAASPDIVWVGLSTPKQERWMAEIRDSLDAPVLIGVGAAFDFHAGLKRQAPRWVQHSGLEWLFRLMTEPRRLWRRYLSNNPRFIWSFLMQWLHIRHYDL